MLCRSWNCRGGVHGGIQPGTRTAVIDIDALLTVTDWQHLRAAAGKLAALVRQYCGGESESYYLSAANPSIEFARTA